MDPISWMVGAGVAGTALSAVGAIGGAQAQAANLQSQATAQQYNAQLYQQQAEQEMAQTVEQANVQSRKSKQALGTQRAATAQSGLGFEGTGGDLINQSAASAELDRQNLLYSGFLNAQGLESQAEQSQWQAEVATSQINPTITGGYLSGAGNILGGASSIAGNYMSANKQRGKS